VFSSLDDASPSRYSRTWNASSGCFVLLRMRNVSALKTAVVVPLNEGIAAMSQSRPALVMQQMFHRKFYCIATLPVLKV
jgi:hypothetical protein